MKFHIAHIEIQNEHSHVEGVNEQMAPSKHVAVADDIETEISVEEAVKLAEIAGKEFFIGIVNWMKEESKISRKNADSRLLEAENERERLAQCREAKKDTAIKQ